MKNRIWLALAAWLCVFAAFSTHTLSAEPPQAEKFVLGSATLSGLPVMNTGRSLGDSSMLLRVFILDEGRPRLLGQSIEVRSWKQRPERDVSFPTLVLVAGKPYVVRIFARDENGEQLVDETAPFWLNDKPGRIDVPFAHGGSLRLPIVGAGLAEATKRSRDRFVLTEATVAGRPSVGPGKPALLFKVVAYEGAGANRAVTVGQSEPVAGGSSAAEIRVRFSGLVLRTRVFYVIQVFLSGADGERLTDETLPFELTSSPGIIMVGFTQGGNILLPIEGAGLVSAGTRSRQLLSMPVQP